MLPLYNSNEVIMHDLKWLLRQTSTKMWSEEEKKYVRDYLKGDGRLLEEAEEWCLLVGMLTFGIKSIPLSSKEAVWTEL